MHQVKSNTFIENGSELWEKIQELLLEEYGEAIFKSWFSHIKFSELEKNDLILTVPSRFIREWILSNYFKSIQAYVFSFNHTIKNIDFRVKSTRAKVAPKCITNDNAEMQDDEELKKCDIMGAALDPRFTFENFVSGDANKAAYSSTKAIAEGKKLPSESNIIYIQSNVGYGKTHLLQAIAAYIRANYKRKKVAYLSADRFIHLYVKSIRSNNLIEFKEKLREADVLLLDDLQFICGKSGTQNEFLNTFSALTESNRKVVVTCDVSPYQLNLDKRSISKLAGGLVVSIKPSDYNLRLDILKAKIKQLNFAVPGDVLELIAKNITSSNRELEGALNKLITHCSLEGSDIDLKAAQEILKDNLDAHDIELNIEQIMEVVASHYGVQVDEITSKSRAARFVLPRQICMYLAKQLTRFSLQDIGFKLGGRDHATVIYSVKKLDENLSRSKSLSNDIAKLIETLSRPQ